MIAQQVSLSAAETGSRGEASHFAQLCAVLALVEQMAPDGAPRDPTPEAEQIAAAYRRAPTVARRRFDSLAREVSVIAAGGVEALIASDGAPEAAAKLAAELRRDVERLVRLVA